MADVLPNSNPELEANPSPELSPAQVDFALQTLRSEQNLIGGALAGLAAAVGGAAVWSMVTVLTGYQIGWMAVGVGFLVGFAVRFVGKGIDKTFSIIGAICALLGCLLGNLFIACYFLAQGQQISVMEVVAGLTPELTLALLQETFSPIDLLFYGIAVYEGFKLSTRVITHSEIVAAASGRIV